jgi:hypothetical protein
LKIKIQLGKTSGSKLLIETDALASCLTGLTGSGIQGQGRNTIGKIRFVMALNMVCCIGCIKKTGPTQRSDPTGHLTCFAAKLFKRLSWIPDRALLVRNDGPTGHFDGQDALIRGA